MVEQNVGLVARAAVYAALGDAHRLAIVEALALSDRAPVELGRQFGLDSNLVAHHLGVLETVGLVERIRSDGDARRRYVRLRADVADFLVAPTPFVTPTVVFVCTHNSARSQLAAALWNATHAVPAASAGTHPAPRVHPAAVAAGAAAGLDLQDAIPRSIDELSDDPGLVITVCDRAHEDLAGSGWRELHWSVPDPARDGRRRVFELTVQRLAERIRRASPAVVAAGGGL